MNNSIKKELCINKFCVLLDPDELFAHATRTHTKKLFSQPWIVKQSPVQHPELSLTLCGREARACVPSLYEPNTDPRRSQPKTIASPLCLPAWLLGEVMDGGTSPAQISPATFECLVVK